MQSHYVYILKAVSKNKYYIGYTINLSRRIRQHNRLISGGAKSTAGNTWEYYAIFTGINNKILGLKLEWRLKHLTKSRNIVKKIYSLIDWYSIYKYTIFLYINYNLQYTTKNIIIIKNVNYINMIISII